VICEDVPEDFNDEISSVMPSNITECFLYKYVGNPYLLIPKYAE